MPSYEEDSPSSGLFRIKVYNEHGMAQRNGTGIFPREVMNRFPVLPLVEEGRLNDIPLRENFVERVLPVGKARQGLLSLDPIKDRIAQHRKSPGFRGISITCC